MLSSSESACSPLGRSGQLSAKSKTPSPSLQTLIRNENHFTTIRNKYDALNNTYVLTCLSLVHCKHLHSHSDLNQTGQKQNKKRIVSNYHFVSSGKQVDLGHLQKFGQILGTRRNSGRSRALGEIRELGQIWADFVQNSNPNSD